MELNLIKTEDFNIEYEIYSLLKKTSQLEIELHIVLDKTKLNRRKQR